MCFVHILDKILISLIWQSTLIFQDVLLRKMIIGVRIPSVEVVMCADVSFLQNTLYYFVSGPTTSSTLSPPLPVAFAPANLPMSKVYQTSIVASIPPTQSTSTTLELPIAF